MLLGALAVLIAVIAGLALLNSFFVELAPGQPDPQPGGGTDGTETDPGNRDDGGGGGDDWQCQDYSRLFFWFFVGLASIGVALFAVGVVRREHNDNRIGSSVWGITSVVAIFLAVLAYGVYRVIKVICDGALECGNANDGTYSSFMVLLAATLIALGIGIVLSHMQRRNFLGTGWGLLGMLLYLPAVLVGFTWFLIRTLCTPELSCALRDQFLDDLALIFWCSVAATVVAIGLGWYVRVKHDHGVFKSGWGVIAILAGLLAVLSGAGWLAVDGIELPVCDTMELPEEELEELEEDPPTCEETRDELRGRLLTGIGIALGIGLLALVLGFVVHRDDFRAALVSVFGIIAIIALALAVLLGLAWVLAGSMCGEGDDGAAGDGDQGAGEGDQGTGGGDGGGGSPGGDTGSGGGSQPGVGGGGGETGTANPVTTPVNLDPRMLTWFFIALLAVVGIVAIVLLLRFRAGPEADAPGTAAPAADAVQAGERAQLMAMLRHKPLASDEAVIAAYRAFCAWATARGLAPYTHETPREHAARVGSEYRIPPDTMDGFLHAYEVARLSTRKPNDAERAAAVGFTDKLATLRATREGEA